MPDPVRATVVDQTVEKIRDAIKHGRYAPGQRLVEADLTLDLGASRGPLREALSRLSAEGLIDIEPYRGAVVRRFSRSDVVELFEVRTALESEAASLAAQRIDIGDHRKLMTAAVKSMGAFRSGDEHSAYPGQNSAFHATIMLIADNSLLAELADQLHTKAYWLQFRQLLTNHTRKTSLADHDAISSAILAGDAKKASNAMRRHIKRSLTATLELPSGLFG